MIADWGGFRVGFAFGAQVRSASSLGSLGLVFPT